MTAFKRLLSQTGGRCFPNTTPPPPHHLVSFLHCHFSTEPQPSLNPESNTESNVNLRQPIAIQPVSYPTKPKPPQSEEIQQKSPPERQTSSLESQDSINRKTRSWTRDEMRYMKDAPVISPVSYPSRVAPLPEDRMNVGEEEKADKNEGLERERRKVEEYRRRGVLAYEKQEESLPFPTLIKVENTDQNNKKKGKMNYDLKEAIQLAKRFLSLREAICDLEEVFKQKLCNCIFHQENYHCRIMNVTFSALRQVREDGDKASVPLFDELPRFKTR
ncbi:hypothetical protein OROHE_012535 [Orobanche hederae]